MELIVAEKSGMGSFSSIDSLFEAAREFVDQTYQDQLRWYRTLSRTAVTEDLFWREYIWCVYVAGFNAKVLSQKFEKLYSAIGPLDRESESVESILRIINHKRKLAAVMKCKLLVNTLGWESFHEQYCKDVDTLQTLPFIGGVTKYHLGRNLGFDVVKPDLHLMRLAAYYKFDDPFLLCEYLSIVFNERRSVVDYILWCYLATHGSTWIVEKLGYDPRW